MFNEIADYAFIAYGTNDFSANADLGARGDDPRNWLEIQTFYGAIRYAVKALRAQNPSIRIMMLTPIYRSTHGVPPKNSTRVLSEFVQAICDMSEELDYRAINDFDAPFNKNNFMLLGYGNKVINIFVIVYS